MPIIGFCGWNVAGKTTAARLLSRMLMEVGISSQILSIADPAKQFVAGLFRVAPQELVKTDSVRQFLCDIIEAGINYKESLWMGNIVDRFDTMAGHKILLIDDVRRSLEADWIRRHDGRVVRVLGVGEDPETDSRIFASMGIQTEDVVSNDGTERGLEFVLSVMFADILTRNDDGK